MQMCPKCGHDNRDSARYCTKCQAELQGLLAANTVLQGRYRVLHVLGCGGMGAVYLTEDTHLGRKKVAIKENFDTSSAAQTQFQREALILANLDHPNLPKVTDHFIEPSGRQYLVMSWVDGQSLLEILEGVGGQPLATRDVLAWAEQLLDALTHCHNRGVIHRDIKPQNIILTPDDKVVLVDFGLVKLYDPSNPRTTDGMSGLGTPEYAPPEQYGAGTGHTDARSDLYSLGATLYHLLTAQPPPMAGQRMADPKVLRPARDINSNLSLHVEKAILKAMELSKGDRFQSAAEMRQALQGGRTKPVILKGPRRAALRVWLMAGMLAGALIGVLLARGPWPGQTAKQPAYVSVAFSPDRELLASGSSDSAIRVWRLSDGSLRTLEGHADSVNSVAFAPDGETLASGSSDGTVWLWRASSGALLRTLEGHVDGVNSVAFAPDGEMLASGSSDRTVRLWRVSDGALLRTMEGHTDEVQSLAFAPDGETVASASLDGTVRLWQVSDGAPLRTLKSYR